MLIHGRFVICTQENFYCLLLCLPCLRHHLKRCTFGRIAIIVSVPFLDPFIPLAAGCFFPLIRWMIILFPYQHIRHALHIGNPVRCVMRVLIILTITKFLLQFCICCSYRKRNWCCVILPCVFLCGFIGKKDRI